MGKELTVLLVTMQNQIFEQEEYGVTGKMRTSMYLTWIKFRVDKISRFSRFLIKTAKLNPREIHLNGANREI